MMQKILSHTPYARRLRLFSREVVATLVLTVLAFVLIFAAVNGGKLPPRQTAGANDFVAVGQSVR